LSKLTLSDTPEELNGESVKDVMLAVHRSYLQAIQALTEGDLVTGLAHVTGGGVVGNTTRILPDSLQLEVNWGAWETPGVFRLIQQLGSVPDEDMRRTFNMGVGLVAVTHPTSLDEVMNVLRHLGENPFTVGSVVA
jgi:phosphoribosylformylglycinamidine cyclo-ligase